MIVNLTGEKAITLPAPKLPPPIVRKTAVITVLAEIDNSVAKTVTISTKEIGQVVLWDSTTTPSYDNLGEWTDDMVKLRILELYNK